MAWEAPPILVRKISRPAFGFDDKGELVSDVSSQALRAIYEALKTTLGQDPQTWKTVEATWFDLLNQTVGETVFQVNWIKGTMHRYSTEFFYLADSYARQLCHHDHNYLVQLAHYLLPQSLVEMQQALSLHLAYQRPSNLFQNLMYLDIRAMNARRTQVRLMWHSTALLTAVHMDYRADFLKNMRELLRVMLTRLPHALQQRHPAQVSESIPNGDTTQWDIQWHRALVIPRYMLGGAALTIALLVLAISAGLTLLGVVALLPLLLGIGWDIYHQQQQVIDLQEKNLLSQLEYSYLQDIEVNTAYANLRSLSTAHEEQGYGLSAVRNAILNLSQDLNPDTILAQLIQIIIQKIGFERVLILWHDSANQALVFREYSHPLPNPERLQNFRLDLNMKDSINQNDPLLGQWFRGNSVGVDEPSFYFNSRLNWVLALLEFNQFYSVPLHLGEHTLGIILVDNGISRQSIGREARTIIDSLATTLAVILENARLYQLQDDKLKLAVNEMRLMAQVDTELVDTLKLDTVLELLMDWALRFTGARLALITLVTDDEQHAKISAIYGCAEDQLPGKRLHTPLSFRQVGIIGRAITTAKTQMVEDVHSDPNYLLILPEIRSHLSVPIRRNRRVIGVMSLETHKETGLTQEHISFVTRLSTRAGVALENALLFTETQNERNKLGAILDKTMDAVIVIDGEHKLVLLNPAAIRLFRLKDAQYQGRYFSTVITLPEFVSYYHEVNQGNPERDRQLNVEEKTFDANAVWVENVGWSIILHDVTPFKELDNLKSQLVASVSHDLKTPLSVMRGFVEMIEITQTLDPKGIEYVGKITNAVDNMVELITNLLDLAKIETGLTLKKVPLNLPEMINEIQDQLLLKAHEKGLRFVNQIPANLPTIEGDELRVQQILNNLIGNAVKYTLTASDITIQVTPEDEEVRVQISDQGVGISPEDLQLLFERFVRIRNEKTQHIDGTGLGLAIVKSLVEAHNGHVGVESEEGVGSTFWFTLPRQ